MPNDDYLADLTKLDGDYQILTELHGEGDARTYLARHLHLNRDVTISVFRAAGGVTADTLAQFAADNRTLTEARHEHIVPDIDGVWLNEQTFAAVRARVRGATLDQTLSASGPMSIGRAAETLRDVVAAITWARETGIQQRNLAPSDIVFQQGSGRVLLSFEPANDDSRAARTECDDARTVRRLAIEMLAGEVDRNVSADEIAVPRSLPADVADVLAALRHCTPRNAVNSVAALLTALDSAAVSSRRDEKTQIVPAASVPLIGDVIDPAREREVPTLVQPSADSMLRPMPVVTRVPRHRKGESARRDDTVVVMRPSFGFNARLATAIVVLAVVAGGSIIALNHRSSPPAVASGIVADTGSNAAGEVALHPEPQPPATVPARRPSPPTIDSTTPKPRTATPPKKRVVVDSAAEAERQFKQDSAADVADPCLSSESSSQRRCLLESIDKNDRELNRVYARLIAAYRRQVGAAAADPDPETVNSLRAEQREWVDKRDVECRDVGDGPLFARSRAACFAQKSTDRARELQQRVDRIPPAS